MIEKIGRGRCIHDHFKYRALPSQGQHSTGPEFNSHDRTLIKCTGLPDNGDSSWMGQTLEGWWLRGAHGESSWIELPDGMEPGTTHVRLGVNNEVPTEANFDPPRLPNQIERPYSWLAWADGRCSRIVDGKHQFLCHNKCFGDPYQGAHHVLHCAVARSAWVAKNQRERVNPSTEPKCQSFCRRSDDCVPTPNTADWAYTHCTSKRCDKISGGCSAG